MIKEREKQKNPGDALKETIAQLTESNKELNCLYTISRIIEREHISLEEIIQSIINVIPTAMRNPENTCARGKLGRRLFATDDFVDTPYRQTCELISGGQPVGVLEVFRKQAAEEGTDTDFSREEEELLGAVAERLGKVIERHRAQAALKKSERRFRDLVENSITGISIIQDNQIVYQNQEQEKLFGPLPRTYVLGDYDRIHPDDVETVMQASRDIETGRIQKLDLDFRLMNSGDDGDPVVKRVFARVMPMEYRGKESILINVIDMTQIMELEQLLFRQDKMASLGRVAAGIAHEIRNPLSGINIYLTTLDKMISRPGGRGKSSQIIDQLKSASNKIESVIKKVMDFAKPAKPKMALIQINQPIKDALNLSAVTLRKSSVSIETHLDEQLPVCYADPNLIEAAVLNLLNNAAEAMRHMDDDKRIAVFTGHDDNTLFIRVCDSGPGVPPDLKNKIFEPFFTSKHDGTGIGLSLCHRIVSDHQGLFSVGEGPFGGAEFRIEFPIRRDEA